jgi:hypothetical protein
MERLSKIVVDGQAACNGLLREKDPRAAPAVRMIEAAGIADPKKTALPIAKSPPPEASTSSR